MTTNRGRLTSPKVFPTTQAVSARMKRMPTSKTKAEDLLANYLQSSGFNFVRNDQTLTGTPDFSFPRENVAVFVDGDFWHGRLWFKVGRAPKVNTDLWIRKFKYNRQRDRMVDRALRRNQWHVLRLWESEVIYNLPHCISRIKRLLTLAKHQMHCSN